MGADESIARLPPSPPPMKARLVLRRAVPDERDARRPRDRGVGRRERGRAVADDRDVDGAGPLRRHNASRYQLEAPPPGMERWNVTPRSPDHSASPWSIVPAFYPVSRWRSTFSRRTTLAESLLLWSRRGEFQ